MYFFSIVEMEHQQSSELEALEPVLIGENAQPIRLSYSFIEFMTRNFSEMIGLGGFGVVYLV